MTLPIGTLFNLENSFGTVEVHLGHMLRRHDNGHKQKCSARAKCQHETENEGLLVARQFVCYRANAQRAQHAQQCTYWIDPRAVRPIQAEFVEMIVQEWLHTGDGCQEHQSIAFILCRTYGNTYRNRRHSWWCCAKWSVAWNNYQGATWSGSPRLTRQGPFSDGTFGFGLVWPNRTRLHWSIRWTRTFSQALSSSNE